jgi:hypothetical protein
MPAPDELLKLVEQFRENRDTYLSDSFTETSLRRQFIDPMFELLGWDVLNRQGHAEAYKEVVHEDSLKIGGSTKSPDYSFRVGPERKFFVETKKPSVNIKQDIAPAFQLRRYGWSAKLALSILTDFEEFAVYDCRVRPAKTDSPSTARVMYVTFDQYGDRWDEIAAVFSRDAVLKGSFDRYAESNKKKRGTTEVDAAFLDEIDGWRLLLARNLAIRNRDLSQRDLNFAVQKTIDRLIFLRICEDRGMETYGRLQVLPNGPDIYPRLCELFREADHRYNSGLFHFAAEKDRHELPDPWTLGLTVDDAVLKEIIRKLYYPDSPYEFSVIGADILGQVYEQFLGKVIRLTAGHQAKVEEKPEVRKAGGVYYTPTYIVEYIVKNTVGKLVEGKTAHEVAARTPTWKQAKSGRPLSVLDPACGSGSFLIGAYQYLLDWYRDWFVADDPKRHKDRVYQTRKGQWRLSTAERKRILLDHIYGVDIDSQAVEVTKLSLLLKVLEGETKETLQRQLFTKQRALPDLADNIKCGNSLIGPDFYRGKQLDLFDVDERLRINVFDWQTEFRQIVQSGGFDAVIGNPPYLYSAGQEYSEYFVLTYRLAEYQTDFYVYFIEKALELVRRGGLHSFIVTDSWLNSAHFSKVRSCLLSENRLSRIAVFDFSVFRGAAIENSVYICARGESPVSFPVDSFSQPDVSRETNTIAPRRALQRGLIDPRWSGTKDRLIVKIEKAGIALHKWVRLNRGLHAYRTDGYGISKFTRGPQTKRDKAEQSYHATEPLDATYLPEVKGRNVDRYQWASSGLYVSYGEWLAEPRTPEFFLGPKIVLRKVLGRRLHGTFIESPAAIDQALYIAIPHESDQADILFYCLGILVSPIGAFYLRTKHSIYDRLYPWYTKAQLSEFPVHDIDLDDANERAVFDKLVALVQHMLQLNEYHGSVKTAHEQTAVQRQIAATDREIDQLVYELYGLTDDEIRIVEEATGADAR